MPYLQLDTINSVTTLRTLSELHWLHTFETAHRSPNTDIRMACLRSGLLKYSNFFRARENSLQNAPTH